MKDVNTTFQYFLRRLTSLSGNNRSLYLPRLHAEQLIDVQEFSYLKGEKAFSVINSLIAGKRKAICQVLDSRLESNNKVSIRLKKLQRIDRFFFEERGSNDLHVGWPFVHGKFSDGTLVRCPLLYFPVQLEQSNGDWILYLREDSGISFNKSFLLAYAHYNHIKVEEDLLDYSFDDWDADGTVFRTQLYQLLKDKIELNFNSELFADELKAFTEFKKSEFDEVHKNGELKLQPEAILGIFPQAGSQLVPDYLQLIEEKSFESIENFFEQKTQTDSVGRILKEENYFNPVEIDEWQEDAMQKVKAGKSIVIQGPPGTGKSQLITNTICDAIANGRKVLLVCQKRVALDVVHERLNKLGLKNFVGLVHDFQSDRKEIYATIAQQIDAVQDYKNLNRGIDVIQVERLFYQVCRTIDTISEELEEFRKALYHSDECGISAKELYLTSDPSLPAVNLKQEYSFFDFNVLPDFVNVLKRYARLAVRFERDDYPWKTRQTFAHTDFTIVNERLGAIDGLMTFKNYFEKHVHDVGVPLTLQQGDAICESLSSLEEVRKLISDKNVFEYFRHMFEVKDEETSLLWLDNLRLLSMNCFKEEGIEQSLSAEELVRFQTALHKRMEARKRSVFRWLKWELFSDDKYWLKRVLVANNLQYKRTDFIRLESRLDNRLNLEHHFTALRNKKWLTGFPGSYTIDDYQAWFDQQKKAIRAKLLYHSLSTIKGSLTPLDNTHEHFIDRLDALIVLLRELILKREGWLQHLSGFQIRTIMERKGFETELANTLRLDYEDLAAFDTLKQSLSATERTVIEKLVNSSRQWNDVALEKLLQNSIRLEWLAHLEAKYPVLRLISSQRYDELEKSLQESVQQKQKLCKELLLLRAREQVYEHIEYNRLNNAVTYRDLEHQVTKKKKVWPLRKVIQSFHRELFNLIPCWMGSPESVSAIFPLETLFDVVIFDEASQCFAERGLPAMARGKQVVVAGDSMQLQPSDLYQARWEEETDSPDAEVNSLLALTQRYLPGIHLQGHYRSKFSSLINFSNREFYKNRLQLLPDFAHAKSESPAIQYIKVEGVWEEQRNATEANEVAEQVILIHEQFPDKEIGVITFNVPQQELILDTLEEKFSLLSKVLPASLMVKNIENVQGDEKDIIIFSIGYAPNVKGVFQSYFGSLNSDGGENRLNVAITRAREQVIVVTSIQPEQLKVEDTKNNGPKLLKQYLAYARAVAAGNEMLFNKSKEFPSEWYLSSKLHTAFVDVSPFPFSDMVVSKLGNYEALILTDDEAYRSSLSAKAAHAYTPLLLERKNWKFTRVFSRNYWLSKERVLLDVKRMAGE